MKYLLIYLLSFTLSNSIYSQVEKVDISQKHLFTYYADELQQHFSWKGKIGDGNYLVMQDSLPLFYTEINKGKVTFSVFFSGRDNEIRKVEIFDPTISIELLFYRDHYIINRITSKSNKFYLFDFDGFHIMIRDKKYRKILNLNLDTFLPALLSGSNIYEN